MIAIVDYGMGNLFSVKGALERLGVAYEITSDIDVINKADGIILPGVGSFALAMQSLKESNLAEAVVIAAQQGKPLLGICLGMQLLFASSTEEKWTEGLNLLSGEVKHFRDVLDVNDSRKVPHMGWNQLNYEQILPFVDVASEDYVYFVHSYVVQTIPSVLVATASYGIEVPAIVRHENIWGMQFHPEKSGDVGMRLLKGWLQYVNEKGARANEFTVSNLSSN